MDISPNFAVVYRFYVDPSKESKYIESWKEVSDYFIEHRGAIGSSLHKTEEGYWLAYSKWPDQKTRDASWQKDHHQTDLPQRIKEAIDTMMECKDPNQDSLPEIRMKIIESSGS